MSEIKHTHGPWAVRERPEKAYYDIVVLNEDVEGPSIRRYIGRIEKPVPAWPNCTKEPPLREKDEAFANARVTAAAPDLLAEAEENLQVLVNLRDKHLSGAAAVVRALLQKRIEATQRAIAKSRGEAA